MAHKLSEEEIKKQWDLCDSDKSGSLSFKEISRLLNKLNVKFAKKKAKGMFKKVDVDGNKQLDIDEFKEFLELLHTRDSITDVFDKASDKKPFITPEGFQKWLQTSQGEKMDLDAVKKLISELQEGANTGQNLFFKGFDKYVSSKSHNSLFNPEHAKLYQDMSQPFCHYFIASSHNTYLLEDQLKGPSSVEAYKNAFALGCKCVELDCWDSDKDSEFKGEPIIFHGHTLTSKITFRSVCETIRDFGFTVSPYPIILSLEVHCNIEGQTQMANIMKEVLGDMLPEASEKIQKLPPPDQLLNKVLLKGKSINNTFSDADLEDEEAKEEEEAYNSATPAEKKKLDKERQATLRNLKKKGINEEDLKPKDDQKKKKPVKISEELSKLIHLKAVHFKSFEKSKEEGKAWEMSSFSENKTNKILKSNPQGFLDYNTRQLSRIYPKGTRFDSSNYDPHPAWNVGSSIVALNYQTGSDPLWTNNGKFLDNGRAGYILKPECMRDGSYDPDAKAKTSKLGAAKTLTITVLDGYRLPKAAGKEGTAKGEIIDPYVKIKVFGHPLDYASKKTKKINNNGFNPMWATKFTFPITHWDLAVILFTVSDYDTMSGDDLIAQFAVNAYNLRPGVRYVPLKDRNGKEYDNASLLCDFKIN